MLVFAPQAAKPFVWIVGRGTFTGCWWRASYKFRHLRELRFVSLCRVGQSAKLTNSMILKAFW